MDKYDLCMINHDLDIVNDDLNTNNNNSVKNNDKSGNRDVRMFEIVCNVHHPMTGKLLMDEDTIKIALAHKTIKQWGYVLHDKDKYLTSDEAENPNHKAGTHKNDHWHIVGECHEVKMKTLARWFNVPLNFIEIPKGKGAFLAKIEYLTHEHPDQLALGKFRYPDERIKANFDFRKELDARNERRAKYGRDLNKKDQIRYDVLYNGMTLKQAEAEDRYNYMLDLQKLKQLRLEYINQMDPPTTRLNYYVTGDGGIGKGLMCRALARSLFPDIEDDYDVFFETGAKGAAFEGYDGQPVIIWNDRRAVDLLMELNGRGNVFNVFDTHPTKQRQKVLYNSINLCNKVNIVNGIEDWKQFLDGLAGSYKGKDGNVYEAEDTDQSYRRFPFMIVLHESDYDMYLNKGFYDGTREFKEWYEHQHIRGSMARIAQTCKSNIELQKELEHKAVQPIVDKHQEVLDRIENAELSENEIRAMFADVGKPIPAEELAEDEMIKQYLLSLSLSEDYTSWLIDDFFVTRPDSYRTSNYPSYEWWFEHIYRRHYNCNLPIPSYC